MEDAERQAVLRGAESTGLAPESPSHGLLRLWIEDRPAPDLMRLWSEYIRALCEELTGEQRERLAQRIVGRAKEVAEAAGGFLGLGSKISRVEQQMLAKMEQVFSGKGCGVRD